MEVYKVFYDTQQGCFSYVPKPLQIADKDYKTSDYEDETDLFSAGDHNGVENFVYCLNKTCLKYVRICKDCGKGFVLTEERKKWFVERGYHLPCRCMRCRDRRKLKLKG